MNLLYIICFFTHQFNTYLPRLDFFIRGEPYLHWEQYARQNTFLSLDFHFTFRWEKRFKHH